MGTYGLHKPHGMKFREILEKELNSEHHKVIDCSIVKRNVAYLACETTNPHTTIKEVYGLVCLITFTPKVTYGCNFYYKPLEESMQPYYYDCPKRILDLLTPTHNVNSLKWREDCRNKKLSTKWRA